MDSGDLEPGRTTVGWNLSRMVLQSPRGLQWLVKEPTASGFPTCTVKVKGISVKVKRVCSCQGHLPIKVKECLDVKVKGI